MKKNIKISIFLDKRRNKINKKYPLKLLIMDGKKTQLISLNVELTASEFEKLYSSKIKNKELLELKKHIEEVVEKAKKLVENVEIFDFGKFKAELLGNSPVDYAETEENSTFTLKKAFSEMIENLRNQGKVSTYQTFICTINSLKKFCHDIDFNDINPQLLENYEKWMIDNGSTITTVGIYLRNLRTILNQAISDKYYSIENYPFGKRKYIIPVGKNIKKALEKEEIKKIFQLELPEGSTKEMARDFWLISYLCNGLNLKDICSIRIKDIQEDKIFVIRAKTKGSQRGNQQIIEIFINPLVRKLIDKWGIPYGGKDDYLFPVLKKGFSPEKVRMTLQDFNKKLNKNLRIIASELNIIKPLVFYSARHSFSTQLMKNGVPIEYISAALGHSNIQITSKYLGSFEEDQKKKFQSLLMEL